MSFSLKTHLIKEAKYLMLTVYTLKKRILGMNIKNINWKQKGLSQWPSSEQSNNKKITQE